MTLQFDLFQNTSVQTIIHGDCLNVMKNMDNNSIDFIVTDPPYSLSFMGKKWDSTLPSKEVWEECLRICKPGAYLLSFGGTRTFHRLTCNIEDAGWYIVDCLMWLHGQGFPKGKSQLKPAWEPIIMARKKSDKVLPLNIDDCRIAIAKNDDINLKNPHTHNKGENKIYGKHTQSDYKIPLGRWPANLILDEESAQMLDEQTGILKSGSGNRRPNGGGKMFNGFKPVNAEFQGSLGGASRFFYCAKASSAERGKENIHPTVKPIALMKYIIKLLAPQNNPILLDPFAGSGSTLISAKELQINAIGIEKEEEYYNIAKERIENVKT